MRPYGDVVDIAGRDGSVLIIPVGSVEQHGYHLPVATDTLLVDAVAHESASRVAESVPVLVTPPVWTGFSPHHMPFGGTLTLDSDDLLGLLEGVAEAALDNGFDSLLFLNGHGGNVPLIGTVSGSVGAAHPETEVTGLTYFDLADPFINEIRESDVGGMGHGGEFETSLMLHLYPDLVSEDRLDGTDMDEPYDDARQDLFVGGPLSVYRPFTEYSDSGAIGSPDLATADKGELLFTRLCETLAALLTDLHDNTSEAHTNG